MKKSLGCAKGVAYDSSYLPILWLNPTKHLKRVHAPQSCFLNRNSKDFDDQNIVDELASYNCELLFRFDSGHSFISEALT